MRRGILTFIVITWIAALANGQEYKTGLGIRAGVASGLTIKHFQNRTTALEGLITSRWQGFVLTGLIEKHAQAFDVEHLTWFYGGGAHFGFYNGNYVTWERAGASYTVLGLDGILGLEYTFSEVPINIGIDWKPAVNLIGYTTLWSEGGLSIRYVF